MLKVKIVRGCGWENNIGLIQSSTENISGHLVCGIQSYLPPSSENFDSLVLISIESTYRHPNLAHQNKVTQSNLERSMAKQNALISETTLE